MENGDSPNVTNVPVSSSNNAEVVKHKPSLLTKSLIVILFILIAAIPFKFIFTDSTGENENFITVPTPTIITQADLPTEKELDQLLADVQSGDADKIASVVNGIPSHFITNTITEKISKLQIEIDAKTVKRDPTKNNGATVRVSVTTPDEKIQKGLLYLMINDGKWKITNIVPDKN